MTLRAALGIILLILILLAVGPEGTADFFKAIFSWIGTFLRSF